VNKLFKETLANFFSLDQPEARRVLHGRGLLFSGLEQLSVDWYPPVLYVAAYKELEDESGLEEFARSVDRQQQIKSLVLQKRYEKNSPAQDLIGNELHNTIVREGELFFEVRPGIQQNAGLFLDMRLLRAWLQANSVDRNVLNLFAYTCSLSVAALTGGANSVTNVDMRKSSIIWGNENHKLNEQDSRCIKAIPHNVFRSWGRIKQYGRYDTVLIDPPTRQHGSFDVARNYPAVLKKLSQLCQPKATVIATVNSPFLDVDFLPSRFSKFVPGAVLIEEMPVAEEFLEKYPERALKIYRFEMP